jgi:glycosyltransferase involved in cell wall biosynthesis
MIIGVDAKRIFKNTTGLGNYSRTLLDALAKNYPTNQYHLFTPAISEQYNIGNTNNQTIHLPTNWWHKKFPNIWRRTGMVNDIAKANIQLFHGLSNELPSGIEKIHCKKVVTVHDLIFERYPKSYNIDERYVHRIKVKKACQIAGAVIATSLQTKQDLVDFYTIDPAKIYVCYQSCSSIFEQIKSTAELELVKEKYNLPNQYFLFVSSITQRKNLLTVCKAMALQKNTNSIPLVVVGNGKKEKNEVIAYMESQGLMHKIIFLNDIAKAKNFGHVPNIDLPAIYQQALALIYPSFFEGFGIPLLEAMWSRLPVISSNTSSLPEVCEKAALYFNPSDEHALATHMQSILHNQALRNDLIALGVQQAQKFTVDQFAKTVMDVYKLVL